MILILPLPAIIRIVAVKTDLGKSSNGGPVFHTHHYVARTSSGEVRVVIFIQTICITIRLQILTDSTVWIISRGIVGNKIFRNVTVEVSSTRRGTSFLARTRTRLRKLLNV